MCKIGDIIFVESYKTHGKIMNQHSFIVIEDNNGKVRGLDYDMIGIVMSSFKSEQQKASKLKYPGNFPLSSEVEDIFDGENNGKDGFAKTEQFYYFDKSKINFRVIGVLQEDIFEEIIKFIEELEIPIEHLLDNL